MTDPPEYFDAHTKMFNKRFFFGKNKTMLEDFAKKKSLTLG